MADEKPNGGEAPQPEKPKKPTADVIEFTYSQLMPMAAFREDGVMYVTFLIGEEFYLSITEFEYYGYLSSYFSQLAENQEAGTCTCDSCTPPFDILKDDEELSITIIKDDDEEEDEKRVKLIPHYVAYSLAQNLIVGLHDDH